MGRPKSRQAPRTIMSIRVSECERRQIEEKAMDTGLATSAYIRTMALDGGNVDTTMLDFYAYLKAKEKTLDFDYIKAECRKLGISDLRNATADSAGKCFHHSRYMTELLSNNLCRLMRWRC